MPEAQSLLDGILLEAGISRKTPDRYNLKSSGVVRPGTEKAATQILDLFARLPIKTLEASLADRKIEGGSATGSNGTFLPIDRTVTLDSSQSDTDAVTLLHEATHAIQFNAFRHAMQSPAANGTKLAKFQDAYIKIFGKYDKEHAGLKSDPYEAYRNSPIERQAFGTDALRQSLENDSSDSAVRSTLALEDLMQLITLLPAEFKQTPKQLSRGY